MRRPLLAAVLVGALLSPALTACTPVAPIPTRTPTPTPLFASDEEALAAAEEAYTAYLAMSDRILNEGGANAERVEDFVTDSRRKMSVESLEKFESSGRRTEGASALRAFTLESVSIESKELNRVVFYVCVDSTAIRVFDRDNVDVTPTTQPTTFRVEMAATSVDTVLLDTESQWDGASVC